MVTVLKTSFAPRPLAPSYIRRPALQRTITRGVERGQVMIVAPGGFGKTSLAADWYENGAGPERCWVTLSDRQNTPAPRHRPLEKWFDRLHAIHVHLEPMLSNNL